MVRTPSYHVFDLYKPHMDATRLPLEIGAAEIGPEKARVPAVHGTASKGPDGVVNVSLVNIDPEKATELEIDLQGIEASKVGGRILTAETMNAHNTFDSPDKVRPAPFTAARLSGGKLLVALPAKSIVTLQLR